MKKWITLLLALAMMCSLAACGSADAPSSTGTKYKVGIVNYLDDASLNQIVGSIQAQLDTRGKELGVAFDYANYSDNAQGDAGVLNQIGQDLIADEVDLIIAVATPTAITLRSATEDTEIPLLFAAISDPVGTGIVEQMEAPGGRITGTSDKLNVGSMVDLMLANDPELSTVGLLYNTAQDSSTAAIAEAKTLFAAKGIQCIEKTGSNTDEVQLAAQALVSAGVDAVFTPTDNTIMAAEMSVSEILSEAGIPHFGGADSFALWGAFCGYGVKYDELGRKTADMAVEILVNGADPATMPVATFDNGNVSINTETCDALGYELQQVKERFSDMASDLVELQTQTEFDSASKPAN